MLWRHRPQLRQGDGDRTMEDINKRRADRWNFLFIAGMWFQDLFNYDFRRTEQCIIPVRDAGRRDQLLRLQHGRGLAQHYREDAHDRNLTKWYEEHGRHEIFAGGKNVGMGDAEHTLLLNDEHVHAAPTTRWTSWASPKTAAKKKSAPARD
jgi:hypothetical protein